MNNIYQNIRANQGFTLVELAIVLIILGFLLTMFIVPLSTQRELSGRSETQAILERIRESLIGYAVVNRHLPCPDTELIPDGLENREAAGNCSADEGIFPWATLGIEGTDAWGRYFRYRADATFSNSATLFTVANAEGSSLIEIAGENGPLVSANSRPAALVLSHGLNGFGAKTTIQASPDNEMPMPAPTALDETENTDGNLAFISHVPTLVGSTNEFDDMVIWVSPKVLINRMLIAQRLP